MKQKVLTGLAMSLALAGISFCQERAAQPQSTNEPILVAAAGPSEERFYPVLNDGQNEPSGSPKYVIDPKIRPLDVEFEQAQTPDAYAKTRAHAQALMAEADKTNKAVLGFEAAVVAADCTYFATESSDQDQNAGWAKAEMADLHEAARRYTTEVKDNWFASRPSYERYANLLTASADHMSRGVLHVVNPELNDLRRQLAAEAEKTISATFSYRVMEGKADNVETQWNLARLSWDYGSREVARARFKSAIDETRNDGRIADWLNLQDEQYKNERRIHPPPVPLQKLRDDARLGAQGLRESYSSRAGRIFVNALFDQVYGTMLKDQFWEVDDALQAMRHGEIENKDELEKLKPSTPEELFRATESLKARTLLDELSSPPGELSDSNRSAAETLEHGVLGFAKDDGDKDDMFMQEMKLIGQLSPFGPLDSEGTRMDSLKQLEKVYQKANAGFTLAAKPASLQQVQSALQPKEAILEYVIPYDFTYPDQYLSILLITHDKFVPIHLKLDDILPRNAENSGGISTDGKAPITFTPLSVAIASLREAIRNDDDKEARAHLSDLYTVLIYPLVYRGFKPTDYDRLIIVPHGPLHYLPFGALLDDEGKFLIQKTAITIVPSASVWLKLQERSRPAVHSFVAFGNPSLNRPDLPLLKAAESEVNLIAGELDIAGDNGKQVLLHEQATKSRLQELSAGASLLHIATHGQFPDENALDRHAVLLASRGSDDGIASAAFVRKLNLSANRLVVLSVCNGGLYRIGPADEPYGLIPAFLQAGSQNAVGTLWEVEDNYGRLLMTKFYKDLLKTGPAEALRQASMGFIDAHQTIGRWSGFVAVGPGRPFE